MLKFVKKIKKYLPKNGRSWKKNGTYLRKIECDVLSPKLNFDGKQAIQIHLFFLTHLYVFKEGRKYLSIRKVVCLFVCHLEIS
jgi:hypothetical protein